MDLRRRLHHRPHRRPLPHEQPMLTLQQLPIKPADDLVVVDDLDYDIFNEILQQHSSEDNSNSATSTPTPTSTTTTTTTTTTRSFEDDVELLASLADNDSDVKY